MRIVVTGAAGQLGYHLGRALGGHDAILLDRDALDVTDARAVSELLGGLRPDAIIHAAAWTNVDACERDAERAHLVNAGGTAHVARAAGAAHVVLVSTDYVFDGTAREPYAEDAPPNPVQVYGHSKVAAERALARDAQRWTVVRTAWLYGALRGDGSPARNFVSSVLRGARAGGLDVVDDQVGSPTWAGDLVRALVRVVEYGATGTFHLVNEGSVSRAELARAVLREAGGDARAVRAVPTSAMPPRAARRPAFAPLAMRAWSWAGYPPMPAWDDALRRAMPEILEAA